MKKQSKGFTLVELMIIIAIAAILVTMAVPSMRSFIVNNQVSSHSFSLVSALNLAKSEAIRSGRNIILCKSNNGTSCNDKTSWSSGWVMFQDDDNNLNRNGDERLIRVQSALADNLNFTFKSGDYIQFKPSGRTNENGRFCFQNTSLMDHSRAIFITYSGRIRTEKLNGADDCKPS